MAAIRYMQVAMGLPELREYSSMPMPCLVQSGIQRAHASKQATKIRLPITPAILIRLKEHWTPKKSEPDIVILWAVAVLCYFGFFQVGDITIPTISGFKYSKHLAWGDVAINDVNSPQSLKVHLKQSKTDQLGKGVDVYIGKTDDLLCPVMVVMAYVAL